MADIEVNLDGAEIAKRVSAEMQNRGGRPSNETKFAALETRIDEMAARIDLLEDELTLKVTEAKQAAEQAALTHVTTDAPSNQYCDLCQALAPYHFEAADGTPCPNSVVSTAHTVPTTTVAETAAA